MVNIYDKCDIKLPVSTAFFIVKILQPKFPLGVTYIHLWDKETLKRTYTISLNTGITNCISIAPPPLKLNGRRGGHCHIKTILRHETSFLKYLDEQNEKKMLYS